MQPLDHVWSSISLFHSSSTTQKYLHKCYKNFSIQDASSASFQNCPTFIYYLEYAQTYYQEAARSSLSLRPILLFYGFIQLLKACLLTIDSTYPSTSSVLAHGVSTRKRKKQQYEFIHDEVKIQKNGLLSFVADRMFHMKHLENNKINMLHLLSEIPEMQNHLMYYKFPSTTKLISLSNKEYYTNNNVLDEFHLTANRLESYFRKSLQISLSVKEEKKSVHFLLDNPLTINYHGPFKYDLYSNAYHLSTNKESSCFAFSEIMIHYLLLYNLSMIARYETEWWMELIKTTPNEDFPLIKRFLDITQVKGPFLISKWLLEEQNYLINI